MNDVTRQGFPAQLSGPKLARASFSSSKLGISFSRCNVLKERPALL